MKRTIIAVTLLIATTPVLAGSVAGFGGSTEVTQISNNIQLAASYAEQAQQTVTQFQQYQTMLKNLINTTPSQLLDQAAGKMFKDQGMTQTFLNLKSIYSNGEKMMYSASVVDQQFNRMYPGSKSYNYTQAYADLSRSAQAALLNGAKVVGAQAEDFSTEEGLIQDLMKASSTAQGQLAATQAGNQISVAMVNQFQKLRQLQMAQMAQQGAIMQQADAQKANTDAMFAPWDSLDPKKYHVK